MPKGDRRVLIDHIAASYSYESWCCSVVIYLVSGICLVCYAVSHMHVACRLNMLIVWLVFTDYLYSNIDVPPLRCGLMAPRRPSCWTTQTCEVEIKTYKVPTVI